jgi:A/G-specific adenine glycosylase
MHTGKAMIPRNPDNIPEANNFRESLLRWYSQHQRILPWRRNPDPYRVWISEIMLQQTQVKTALPYYDRFLSRFPDIEALAKASEREVLNLWAGLGYYSRARNLHKAARKIVKEHGSFPQEYSAVLALPGVGRYTAGAVCSIAFNQPHPVVDGNIRRVLVRLNGLKAPPAPAYFWDRMSALLPERNASSFNQAMMELGALICVPLHPRCGKCPVRGFCKAFKLGIQDRIPEARAGRAAKNLQMIVLVIERNTRILLTSVDKPQFIPGKWGLPSRILRGGKPAEKAAALFCRKILGANHALSACAQVRHSISNYRIHAHAFCLNPGKSAALRPESRDYVWASCSQYKIRLISSMFRKIIQKYGEFRSAISFG